jgi:hypothetical protein
MFKSSSGVGLGAEAESIGSCKFEQCFARSFILGFRKFLEMIE